MHNRANKINNNNTAQLTVFSLSFHRVQRRQSVAASKVLQQKPWKSLPSIDLWDDNRTETSLFRPVDRRALSRPVVKIRRKVQSSPAICMNEPSCSVTVEDKTPNTPPPLSPLLSIMERRGRANTNEPYKAGNYEKMLYFTEEYHKPASRTSSSNRTPTPTKRNDNNFTIPNGNLMNVPTKPTSVCYYSNKSSSESLSSVDDIPVTSPILQSNHIQMSNHVNHVNHTSITEHNFIPSSSNSTIASTFVSFTPSKVGNIDMKNVFRNPSRKKNMYRSPLDKQGSTFSYASTSAFDETDSRKESLIKVTPKCVVNKYVQILIFK
jgi:hypothetical protein